MPRPFEGREIETDHGKGPFTPHRLIQRGDRTYIVGSVSVSGTLCVIVALLVVFAVPKG